MQNLQARLASELQSAVAAFALCDKALKAIHATMQEGPNKSKAQGNPALAALYADFAGIAQAHNALRDSLILFKSHLQGLA